MKKILLALGFFSIYSAQDYTGIQNIQELTKDKDVVEILDLYIAVGHYNINQFDELFKRKFENIQIKDLDKLLIRIKQIGLEHKESLSKLLDYLIGLDSLKKYKKILSYSKSLLDIYFDQINKNKSNKSMMETIKAKLGLYLNEKSELYANIVIEAFERGLFEFADYLIRNVDIFGLDRNSLFKLDVTMFALCGNLDSVEFYIEELKENINYTDSKGNSILYYACSGNHLHIVQYLIHKGADLNIKNKKSVFPLYIACQKGNFDIVKLLIENGADTTLKYKDFTPLKIAYDNKHMDIVSFFISKRILGDDFDNFLYSACQKGYSEIFRSLINSGENIDGIFMDTTLLYFAAQKGYLDIVKMLINLGFDIEVKYKDQYTPLYVASLNGHEEIVKFLLSKSANIEHKCDQGSTPLYVASQQGNVAVVKTLLDFGANTEVKFIDTYTPLYIASKNGHLEVVKLLLSKGANTENRCDEGSTPLYVASQEGQTEIVKALLDFGANIEIQFSNSYTPLCIACHNNRVEVVRLLLDRGAIFHILMDGIDLPLHVSSYKGYKAIVQLLINRYLELGLDFNLENSTRHTAFDLALKARHFDIAELFYIHNAKLNLDKFKIPEYANYIRIKWLHFLLQHGYDYEHEDKYCRFDSNLQWSPFDIDSRTEMRDLESMLLKFQYAKKKILDIIISGNVDTMKDIRHICMYFSKKQMFDLIFTLLEDKEYSQDALFALIKKISQEFNLSTIVDDSGRNLLVHTLNKKNYPLSCLLISLCHKLLDTNVYNYSTVDFVEISKNIIGLKDKGNQE